MGSFFSKDVYLRSLSILLAKSNISLFRYTTSILRDLIYRRLARSDQSYDIFYYLPSNIIFKVYILNELSIENYNIYLDRRAIERSFKLNKTLPVYIGKSSLVTFSEYLILVNKYISIERGSFFSRLRDTSKILKTEKKNKLRKVKISKVNKLKKKTIF